MSRPFSSAPPAADAESVATSSMLSKLLLELIFSWRLVKVVMGGPPKWSTADERRQQVRRLV